MPSTILNSITYRHLHLHQSTRAFQRAFAVASRVTRHRYRLPSHRRAALGRLYSTYALADYLRSQSVFQSPHWFYILPSSHDLRGLLRVRHVATGKILFADPIPVHPGTVVRGCFDLATTAHLATAESLRVIWSPPPVTRYWITQYLAHHTPTLTLRCLARLPGVATVLRVTGPRRDRDRLVFSPQHALWRLFYLRPPSERFVVLSVDDPIHAQVAQAFGCPVTKVWEIYPGVWTVATHKTPDPALVAVVARALGVTILQEGR